MSSSTAVAKKYTNLVTINTCLFIFFVGIFLIALNAIIEVSNEVAVVAQSIGGSLVASIIVFVLITVFIEFPRQQVNAQSIADYAIGVANESFTRRFEANLPIATYEASGVPKKKFQKAFSDLVSNTTRYVYKGGVGDFTAFRLHSQCRRAELQKIRDIHLCIIDPRSNRTLEAFLDTQSNPKKPSVNKSEAVPELKLRIYTSLYALFEVREYLPTKVYLHEELLSYRCELFDRGLFLTYFVDSRNDFQETIQYESITNQFKAYDTGLAISIRYSGKIVEFGTRDASSNCIRTEGQFEELLKELECDLSLEQLEALMKKRHEDFSRKIREGALDSDMIF